MAHFAEINQAPPPYSMLQYMSQILANNIDNGGRGIGLKIYVRYCSFFCHSNLRWETGGFELASTMTLVFKIPLLVIYYLTKFDDVTQSGF